MTLNRRRFLTIASAAAGAAAVPAAARAQFNNQYQRALSIALNLPLSGTHAASGQEIYNGVQAAVDEVNRFGGSFGTAFQVRPFDDMGSLGQAIGNAQFAASDVTVLATIGDVDANVIAGTLQSYANARMPIFVPGSTADVVTARGYRNVWRLPVKDSTEGQLAAAYAVHHLGVKTAVAVAQDGVYGGDVASGFVNGAHAAKASAVAYLFPSDRPNYAAAAKAILTKNPDFVYLSGVTSDLGPLIPALRAAGYKGKFGGSQGFYNTQTLRYADEFAGGLISTSMPPFERMTDPSNYLADFRARSAVTALSAFGYAAAQIIIAASRRAGATTRLAMLSALQGPTSYNTIVGSLQFGFDGDPIDPLVYFYAPDGNKFKFLAPSHATPFVL